jgi:hypothetical protein
MTSQYPQPPPGTKVKAKKAKHFWLPPPEEAYTSMTEPVQGWDLKEAPHAKKPGAVTYPGGYHTTPQGLQISAVPWNYGLGDTDGRQQRANEEALVANYWPHSPTFGPGGPREASAAVITYLLISKVFLIGRNGVHTSTMDSRPHITTQWYAAQPAPPAGQPNHNYLGLSHVYPPPYN